MPGYCSPTGGPAPGFTEAQEVAAILEQLPDLATARAPAAILFDYPSDWAWKTQPQGAGFDYFRLIFSAYRALRRAGLSVDILPSSCRDFDGYSLILAPGLAELDGSLAGALAKTPGLAIIGPRSGAITSEFCIPDSGRPGIEGLDCHVDLVESLPPATERPVAGGGTVRHWYERVTGSAETLFRFEDETPMALAKPGLWYLAGFPDDALWDRILATAAERTGLSLTPMPDGLRPQIAG